MKFGRKSRPEAGEPKTDDVDQAEEVEASSARGPHDEADVDVERDGVERLDFGSLLVAPLPGTEIRMSVDEQTQAVQSVLLAGPEGGVELRAFARSRSEEMWPGVREAIAEDFRSRGGTVEEREGPWGTELVGQMQVTLEDGRVGNQPSRVVGIDGPRWFVRAMFLGKPALEPAEDGPYEQMLSGVVVRRGTGAMAPGDPLPMKLPPQARRAQG